MTPFPEGSGAIRRVSVKSTLILASMALTAAAGLLSGHSVFAQDGPAPSAGTLLASGLQGSLGAVVGPDGALYVAEAGTGGDIVTTPPEDFPADEPVPTFGLTGRVSRIDPETGERTTVGEGIGSLGGPEGAGGAVDVAFIGSTMYVLTTGGANYFGQEDWPNGIYRVNGDNVDLIADISEFNDENPVDFPDAAPGGNPFALDVRGSEFLVTDGNYNRVLRVATNGNISILTSYDNIVPTGIEAGASGPVLVTNFGPFPHTPENSFVNSITFPGGASQQAAGGVAQLIDVEDGPDDGTFVLSFGDPATDPEGPPATPFSGQILTLEDGTMSTLVTGFMLPTSLDFSDDTAYVTTLLGEVWQIEDFSSVEPPAPTPTAAPTQAPVPTATPATGVTAPDTGTGPSGGNDALTLQLAVLLAAAGLATGAAALALKRA
jgi:hypothetical protein